MTENASERVSLDKSGAPAGTASNPRPKQAKWVIAALVLSGVFAVVGSLSLFGLHHFLLDQLTMQNAKLAKSKQVSHSTLVSNANRQPTASLTQSAILLFALSFVATSVWRGRYWARWAVIGLWALSTFTQLNGGLFQLLYITQSSFPIALKVPVTLSSLAFLAAVVLAFMNKPFVAWLNLSRPAARAGAPARRGLFGPRPQARAATPSESVTPARDVDRSRSKQRVNAEAVQRGADEARARARSARASKSRRISQ